MGIPSYFSYIIKNYSNIIRNLKYFVSDGNFRFDHLYMDCNSIIYDSVRLVENNNSNAHNIEEEIIATVISKIKTYIDFINPTETVFIAFDGVAPFAKMEQQRTRRYKSWFLSLHSFNSLPDENRWNTSAITPGTAFMNKLSMEVERAFMGSNKKIIVSGSNIPGEGEHKMYKYIRDSKATSDNIAVYGLDADLIMLSIFHLKYSKNIYVFRETPDFFKNLVQIEPSNNEPHFLDIRQLSVSILCEINCRFSNSDRINDYVLLCFFLGNDFLPHFPAMNIRTHGINALLDVYRNCIGNYKDRYLISCETNRIQWKNIGILLKEIAKNERQLLLNEYSVRKKFDHFKFLEKTPEEKDNVLLNAPIIYRAEEKFICPEEPYWEKRYYNTLFHMDNDHNNVKQVCRNYFEGLEWVYVYYNSDCPNWRWKYNYHYPPLFSDLCKHIPENNEQLVKRELTGAVHPYIQLCYVLPFSNLYLLPNELKNEIEKNYAHLYPSKYNFQWAFCRYFWEAHPILPNISLELFESLVSTCSSPNIRDHK